MFSDQLMHLLSRRMALPIQIFLAQKEIFFLNIRFCNNFFIAIGFLANNMMLNIPQSNSG